jgi:hypothetical protein
MYNIKRNTELDAARMERHGMLQPRQLRNIRKWKDNIKANLRDI